MLIRWTGEQFEWFQKRFIRRLLQSHGGIFGSPRRRFGVQPAANTAGNLAQPFRDP
jgi:hypothetical protein